MTAKTTSSTENQYKKKSTPEGAPLTQLNGTTFEEKSEAEILFDRIRIGSEHALKRPKDPKVDRRLRQLIADANMNGDCIINSGNGYYRPGAEDRAALEIYLKKEMHRIRELKLKALRMSLAYNRRYQ